MSETTPVGALASATPASAPLITPERKSRLKQLVLARCHGDRAVAKPLYRTMRGAFEKLRPATQDALLSQMSASLPVLQQLSEIVGQATDNGAAQVGAEPAPDVVDALMRSITAQSSIDSATPSAILRARVVEDSVMSAVQAAPASPADPAASTA